MSLTHCRKPSEVRLGRTLLIILGGLLLHGCRQKERGYVTRAGMLESGEASFSGMWKVQDGREKLDELLLIPRDVISTGVYSSDDESARPHDKGISILPSGVYWDGKIIKLPGVPQVMVLTGSGAPAPVPLSPEEVQEAGDISKPGFASTKIWKDRISPQIRQWTPTSK